MFKELNLSDDIINALELKGFTIPTEIQTRCIPLILNGKDIVGRSQTGSGKTFAFGLPAIEKIDTMINAVQVLILCPTRELALQVTDELRKITESRENIKVVPVFGGADIVRQIKALKNGKIVVGTPGRLMDHLRRKTLKLDKIKMVVLDEADEMLNMGFKDDIEEILKNVKNVRQTVMFSATMPPLIKEITRNYMVSPEYIELGGLNSTLKEIEQSYLRTLRNGKKVALIELFKKISSSNTIVFTNTKKMAEELKELLVNEGINALSLHGDKRQSERNKVMSAIRAHKASALIATDVAARGIDIDDIEYIINFDLPNDIEYYIHRIGRTARAGKSGISITLINTTEQFNKLREYARLSGSEIKEHYLSEYKNEKSSDKEKKKVSANNNNADKGFKRAEKRSSNFKKTSQDDDRQNKKTDIKTTDCKEKSKDNRYDYKKKRSYKDENKNTGNNKKKYFSKTF